MEQSDWPTVGREWRAETGALSPAGLTSQLGLHRRENDMADVANQVANRIPTNLVVNGVRRTLDLVPWTTLLDALRDHLALTGTKKGCDHGALHPLQQAFIDHDAFQCGYCTPGQICSAAGLLAEGRAGDADEIRELMSGNLCRCGAYPNIVAAIQQAVGRP
jgi:xanthine dehydrogenase YagT iron-sulfur-binding subunit